MYLYFPNSRIFKDGLGHVTIVWLSIGGGSDAEDKGTGILFLIQVSVWPTSHRVSQKRLENTVTHFAVRPQHNAGIIVEWDKKDRESTSVWLHSWTICFPLWDVNMYQI